jgi:hypothetical protein
MRTTLSALLLLVLLAGCAAPAPTPTPRPSPAAVDSPAASPAPTATPSRTPVAAHFDVGPLVLVSDADQIVPGSTIEVEAEVANAGELTGTYLAELVVDGLAQPVLTLALEPGQRDTVRFSFVAGDPGPHALALVDQQLTIDVLGPAEIAIQWLSLSADAVERGEELSARVTLFNKGGLAGSQTVELLLDGRPVASEEATLGGGERLELRFPLALDDPGSHTVSVGDLSAGFVVHDIRRPASGRVFVNRIGGGEGRLTIENDQSEDVFLVLARADRPERIVLATYVHAGQKHTIRRIRDGDYIVFVASGERWDRHSGRFTRHASYERFADPIDFVTTRRRYTVWTISLGYGEGDGDPTLALDEHDFPELAGQGDD